MLTYQTPAVRVYRYDELDDAPSTAVARAQQSLAEHFDPQDATDYATDWFNEEHRPHGIELESGPRTGPFWSCGGQGEGASLTIRVDDFAAYLRWRDCDRHVARRLLWLHDQGEVCLSFAARSGHYCGTFANIGTHYSDGLPGESDRSAAAEWLASDAKDAASDLEDWFLAKVRADYEYAGSDEHLASELRDLDQGLTEHGEIVSLDDCEEGGPV